MATTHGRWLPRAITGVLVVAGTPGVARAHQLGGSRFAAPLPLSLLFAGAGLTVAVTAAWLAFTRYSPRHWGRHRHLVRIPRSLGDPLLYVAQGLFFASVVAVLIVGVGGRQVAVENFATVFTWPVWFRGLAVIAIIIGNPWTVLSPWRLLYRGLSRLEGRSIRLRDTYPRRVGAWPAVVGFIALIGVIGNLTVIPRSPRLTAGIIGIYALVMLAGAVVYGHAWVRRADPLGVLYELFGRVSIVTVARSDPGDYTIGVRPPWTGCLRPAETLSIVVFIVAMVYTVSFDGFTNTQHYQTVLFDARGVVHAGPETSILLYLGGLAGFVITFGVTCWLVQTLATGTPRNWARTARWFAPSLLPIAAAYEVAHSYPYVLRNAGQLLTILLHPAIEHLDFLGWLSLPVFWGSQVGLIVVGHVIAVVAAHTIARSQFADDAGSRRGHLPFVVLMIGYTILSLWIISQPVIAE